MVKTQLAANRGQSLKQALSHIYARGGLFGFYQGLIPWAWIEASTKGAVLLFTASEFEHLARAAGASPFLVKRAFFSFLGGPITYLCANLVFFICVFRVALQVVWEVVLHKPIQPWASVPL